MPASSSMISTDPAIASGSISFMLLCVITAASDIDGLPSQRKIQVKRRAFAWAAFHAYLARMLLDNAVSYRQAQPCTPLLACLGCRFGGEEGIVDARDVFRRNPAPGIGHNYADAAPVRCRNPQG